jgi:hypothetical protein
MYFGLRQIAALPTRLDPGTKTAKKASKDMQAPHWPTRSKKARPRQVPVKFLIDCILRGKNFTGSLAFFPRLHVGVAFFFSGFFFVEMALIKLYTMA